MSEGKLIPLLDVLLPSFVDRLPVARFSSEIPQDWLPEELRGLRERPLWCVYHYTSAESFFRLFHEDDLRVHATDVAYGNDETEFRLVKRLSKDWLSRNGKRLSSDSFVDPLSDTSAEFANPYTVCVSGNPDDLSQWRAYCSPVGVAIGLDPGFLLDTKQWRMFRCEYSDSFQREIVHDLLETLVTIHGTVSRDGMLTIDATAALEVALGWIAPHFKHSTFKVENEFRLQPSKPGQHVGYEPYRRGVRPFVEMQLAKEAIKTIHLGPGFVDEDSVRGLLSKLGMEHVLVIPSRSPYRGPS